MLDFPLNKGQYQNWQQDWIFCLELDKNPEIQDILWIKIENERTHESRKKKSRIPEPYSRKSQSLEFFISAICDSDPTDADFFYFTVAKC